MKMAHVSIFSKWMDESVAFYQDIVGLTVQRDMRDNPLHPIVFLANAAGETCVEIIGEPDNAFQGTGISMGFVTDDAEATRAESYSPFLPYTVLVTAPFPATFETKYCVTPTSSYMHNTLRAPLSSALQPYCIRSMHYLPANLSTQMKQLSHP